MGGVYGRCEESGVLPGQEVAVLDGGAIFPEELRRHGVSGLVGNRRSVPAKAGKPY
jgi:hypothetical protein